VCWWARRGRRTGSTTSRRHATCRALLSGVEFRLALGQLEEAARDNDQAGRLLERLTDDLGLEQVEQNRGLISEKQGQWEDAERAFERAIAMCRRHRLPADETEVLYHLARLRFKTRNLDGARAAIDAATRLGITELRPNLAPAFAELKAQVDRAFDAGPSSAEGRLAP
jgi:tetratricopeptide (TPR) repeat protein